MRNLGLSSAAYSVVCFTVAAAVYLVVVFTGNVTYRDATGDVVDAVVPTKTVFVSSLFMGAVVTVLCAGGLFGLWIVSFANNRSTWKPIIRGSLLALICAGVFTVGSSLSEDHLVLRAILVSAISLLIGAIVKNSRSPSAVRPTPHGAGLRTRTSATFRPDPTSVARRRRLC